MNRTRYIDPDDERDRLRDIEEEERQTGRPFHNEDIPVTGRRWVWDSAARTYVMFDPSEAGAAFAAAIREAVVNTAASLDRIRDAWQRDNNDPVASSWRQYFIDNGVI